MQDVGRDRAEGRFGQENEGGGSQEGGHLLLGPAGQPHGWSSCRWIMLQDDAGGTRPAKPRPKIRLKWRHGVHSHGRLALGGAEKTCVVPSGHRTLRVE